MKNRVVSFAFIFLLGLLFPFKSISQTTWEFVARSLITDQIRSVDECADGSFVFTGLITNNDFSQASVGKISSNGALEWLRFFPVNGMAEGINIHVLSNDSLFVTGITNDQNNLFTDPFSMLLDEEGQLVWTKIYSSPLNDYLSKSLLTNQNLILTLGITGLDNQNINNTGSGIANLIDPQNGNIIHSYQVNTPGLRSMFNSAKELPNGDFIVVGDFSNTGIISYFNSSLALLDTQFSFGLNGNNQFTDFEILANGDVLAMGFENAQNPYALNFTNANPFITKITPTGNVLWKKSTETFSPTSLFFDMDILANEDLVFTGFTNVQESLGNLWVVKTDNQGNIIWEKEFGGSNADQGNTLIAHEDYLLVAGTSKSFGHGFFDSYILKLDPDGNSNTLHLEGILSFDQNENCTLNNEEVKLNGWNIKGTVGADIAFDQTDTMGFYSMQLENGNYGLEVLLPNPNWTLCDPSISNISSNTIKVDYSVQALENCQAAKVNVSTPLLIFDYDNVYSCRIQNEGTIPLVNTEVHISLDPFMSFVDEGDPNLIALSDSTLGYQVDFLEVGASTEFNFKINLIPDTPIGKTHCLIAETDTTNFCTQLGPVIQATGFCANDSVYVQVKNTGENGSGLINYNVYEYLVVQDEWIERESNSFDLNLLDNGMEYQIALEETQSTYFVLFDPIPQSGSLSQTSTFIESCDNSTLNGDPLQFPLADKDPFIDIHCEQNTIIETPLTSNENGIELEMFASPRGCTDAHIIEIGESIEYLMYFQNKNDEVITHVQMEIVLSDALETSSLNSSLSSHNGTLFFSGTNRMVLNWDSITLANDPISFNDFGYFKFKIKLDELTPTGNLINTSSTLHVRTESGNEYSSSNSYVHQVNLYENCFNTPVANSDLNIAPFKIGPNPISTNSTNSVLYIYPKIGFSSPVTMQIYALDGSLITQQELVHWVPKTSIPIYNFKGWSTGMYLIEFSTADFHHTEKLIILPD